MQIVCPNCAATYEVDAALLPAEGRAVECSSCGHGWVQRAEPPRPALDDGVREILREEAEREAKLRRGRAASRSTPPGEAKPQPPKTPPSRQREGPAVAGPQAVGQDAPGEHRPPESAQGARSLQTVPTGRELAPLGPMRLSEQAVAVRERRGFRRGFLLTLLVALAALGAYLYAPALADIAPGAEPILSEYVDGANRVREQVDRLVEASAAELDAFIAQLFG